MGLNDTIKNKRPCTECHGHGTVEQDFWITDSRTGKKINSPQKVTCSSCGGVGMR